MSIFRRAIQKGEFATTFFHVFPAEGLAPKEQKMRRFIAITVTLIVAALPGGTALADMLIATPAPVTGTPLTIGDSDFNYEGDAVINGANHDVDNQDPQGWVQNIYDTNITWSAADGVATVQLTTPKNDSDGSTMKIGMKAGDGTDGLGHTVDVRAARPNNTWQNLGGAGDAGRGSGFIVSAPIDLSTRKFYWVLLGDAKFGGDPTITDKLIVEVFSGAKNSDPAKHEITVPGLDIEEMNLYRLAMNADADLRVYVNEWLAYSEDGVLTYNDDGRFSNFGLIVPRSPAGETNFQLDIDYVRIDADTGIFEAPTGTGMLLGGDANGDGVVDVADLGILGANFNQSNMTIADGDFNDDGIVDVADLGILGANWTASQSTGNASALVPEPTTLSLLAISVLMVGRRQR